MANCSYCGTEIQAGQKFCTNCGAPVAVAAEAQNVAQGAQSAVNQAQDMAGQAQQTYNQAQQEFGGQQPYGAQQQNMGQQPYSAQQPYTAQPQNMYSNAPQADDKATKSGKTAFILGLVSIVAWLIPIVCYPVAIVGIIMGVQGLKGANRKKAIIGIVLCGIFLLLALVNSMAGVMMNLN